MRIEQITKYRCDGCGYEATSPYDWRSFVMLGSGMFLIAGSHSPSQDYCSSCVTKMKEAVKPAKAA